MSTSPTFVPTRIPFNTVRLYQSTMQHPYMLADGMSIYACAVSDIIARHSAFGNHAATRWGPATIINTTFIEETTIADLLGCDRRVVINAIQQLTAPWVTTINSKTRRVTVNTPAAKPSNPTGLPYLTKDDIPGFRCNRYLLNIELYDMMGSPFDKQDAVKAAKAAAPAADDDVRVLDPLPTTFLPAVDGDAANLLAREYFKALGSDHRYMAQGKAWEAAFAAALVKHTVADITGAMKWAFGNTEFWAGKLPKFQTAKASVPYFLSKLDDQIMRRYHESLKPPASSTSTRPPAPHIQSNFIRDNY